MGERVFFEESMGPGNLFPKNSRSASDLPGLVATETE